jgi:hypothetical protein
MTVPGILVLVPHIPTPTQASKPTTYTNKEPKSDNQGFLPVNLLFISLTFHRSILKENVHRQISPNT